MTADTSVTVTDNNNRSSSVGDGGGDGGGGCGGIQPEQDNVQKPSRSPSIAECIRRDAHCKCALLTVLLMACFATMAWCRLAQVTRVVVNFAAFPITQRLKASPCDDGYFYLPIVFAVSLYALYLIECWRCAAKLAFGSALKPDDVRDELARMREALPIIWWKAVSYHYMRRSRQVCVSIFLFDI